MSELEQLAQRIDEEIKEAIEVLQKLVAIQKEVSKKMEAEKNG